MSDILITIALGATAVAGLFSSGYLFGWVVFQPRQPEQPKYPPLSLAVSGTLVLVLLLGACFGVGSCVRTLATRSQVEATHAP
ncbi:MAG: hypothetical protein ACK4N5_18580 [Myxococcales bacterium]